MNELTDFKFWENYWDNVKLSPTEDVFFKRLVKDYPERVDSIEIGGFPGKLAVYFNKIKQCNVTILDFFISDKVIGKVEDINKIKRGTIKTIKADFLTYKSDKKYDIVCSFGFIEHFENTKDIINKHVELLKEGGNLLITLPNFRGINGWVQRKFDRGNYDVHFIECMDIDLLKKICLELNLKNISVDYFGKPAIWLENYDRKTKLLQASILLSNKLGKIVPFKKNKILAPYIYLRATK